MIEAIKMKENGPSYEQDEVDPLTHLKHRTISSKVDTNVLTREKMAIA
jgi:hypothetical protein